MALAWHGIALSCGVVKTALACLLVVACSSGNAPPAKPAGHVDIVDAPAGTADVAALVKQQQQELTAAHRRLVVYVGAAWCEPCQQIHAAIVSHRLDTEFPDLTLLAFDLDRDGAALDRAGYSSSLIPLFAIPDADGRGGRKREFGGRKDIDNVPLLTGKLHRLLD